MFTAKLATYFLLLLTLSAHGNGQPVRQSREITWNIRHDVDLLIPSGEITVQVLDHSSVSRRQALLQKAMLMLQQHPEILRELYELHDIQGSVSQRAELFRELGFTHEEFVELERILDTTDTVVPAVARIEKVAIARHVGRIGFEAGDRLRFLNELVIDPENNVVMIGKNVLSDRDTITVSNPDNVYGTTWKGYRWSCSHGMPNLDAGEPIENVDAEKYTVTLGYRDSDGRTFLEVSATEIRSGRIVVNYAVPIVFE